MKGKSLVLCGLVLIMAVAGCVDSDDVDPDGGDGRGGSGDSASDPSGDLFGWVIDTSFEPVESVNLSVIGAPEESVTNASGYFSFPRLPRSEELVVIAEHDGFQTQSKRVLLPSEGSIRMNFTLEPTPVKTPWDEVLEFRGLLACQGVVEYDEGHRAASSGVGTGDPGLDALLMRHGGDPASWSHSVMGTKGSADDEGEKVKVDCGTLDPNNADQWEFAVASGLAGVIVELTWEAESPLAEFMKLTLEIDGTGSDNATLAEAVGPNVLRAQVNNHQAQRYFQEGGHIRATIEVDANVDQQETGTGVAFAYQQEFQVHASAFYVDPPPATYSVHS